MSMHPMGPMKKPKQAEMTVDLKQAETLQCEKCTNYLFITSFVLKRISKLMSPTGPVSYTHLTLPTNREV